MNPIFDWLDEGEPGNRSAAADPDDEANHGEYIDGSLVTAGWSGNPSTYDAVVPTSAEKKRVVIHDGGIIRARTDSDNDGDLDPDDDEKEKDANSLGRVIMVNNDQDGANENDRAETTFYVWLDSLTPEAAPVLVDVYVPNALKLKMRNAAAGGTELPFGQDVNPADGRMDEGTRLVTLGATTTSYDETVYVEATDDDAGRLTLNLCADVVSGGPDGSDPTYYTTLKIDALAMAFNHDVSNTGADGLNIRQDGQTNTELIAPEWLTGGLPARGTPPPGSHLNDGNTNQRGVLYLAGKTVTVYNRIAVLRKFAGLTIVMKAEAKNGTAAASIGGLQEVEFVVGVDGVLRPPSGGAATKPVNDYPDFTEFAVDDATDATVRREEIVFNWEVKHIGVDATKGNATGSNRAIVTDPIKTYTVLDTPKSPWDVSDDYTVDDTNQPWVKALEFVTLTAGVNMKTDVDALAMLTTYLHSGHGLTYDTLRGAPAYASSHLGGTMLLSQYIDKSLGNKVNCYDQAAAVTSLGRLLGIQVEYRWMSEFGYINTVDLVGEGNTNNPFYPTTAFPKLADPDETGRSGFANHAFAMYGVNVYDACALDAGTRTLAAYIAAVIDTSTPAEAAVAGDSGDVVAGDVTGLW